MESSIILKIIVGFFVLLAVIRFLGKKELSELTPIDLINLLVLGGLLEESIYDENVRFWEVPYAALLWSILIYLFDLLIRKFDKLRPALKGKPSVLIRNGKLDVEVLRRNKLESEQLRSMLRQLGIFTLTEVQYAVLEPSGELSVMQKTSSSPITPSTLKNNYEEKDSFSYLIVDEGKIKKKILEELNVDENWVKAQLEAKGHMNLEKVFYAEWSEENEFFIVEYDEK